MNSTARLEGEKKGGQRNREERGVCLSAFEVSSFKQDSGQLVVGLFKGKRVETNVLG